ncbi:hypothetical protein VCR14J2_410154 [Vibrio coralliirubri]|nr:hypothetical protein VCR14J2_410154 [Vibrio coralliirubri]
MLKLIHQVSHGTRLKQSKQLRSQSGSQAKHARAHWKSFS